MANTDQLLAERATTHGSYTEHASITQQLKDVMHGAKGWGNLAPIQRESLDMFAHKIGRILAGNPFFADHWADIAGYARLVELQVERMQGFIDPDRKQAAE